MNVWVNTDGVLRPVTFRLTVLEAESSTRLDGETITLEEMEEQR